ncbi:MAG: bifunctional 4-hydroxy-2-oxoglutarate aldolase/2-dehydro-3-deoxy-phosphogluconate aldolase [Trueperaceae bacterium]|nr:bifunctional 4-hydroxy-2-oxoglutarate aldolase/2-dehydro-3-deoxy-phosphogluconate aldolase [Trueperaceae bacterium]
MAQHSRLEVFERILETGLVPIFYHGDFELATSIIDACIAGGATIIEFTNRGEKALEVFSQLKKHYAKTQPELILGIGTITEAATAALFIAQGADFLFSPSFNPEMIKLCNRRRVASVPGCATVSEINAAEELGAEIIKVFPGDVIRPEGIKAILGPCPRSLLMPTGGVDASQESIHGWFKAGACAVGLGSKLIKKEDIEAKNFAAITERCKQVLGWIKEVK